MESSKGKENAKLSPFLLMWIFLLFVNPFLSLND